MVTDIKVSPYYDNSEVHVALTSTLSLGNVTLPGVSLPIIMPTSGEDIGSIEMQTALGGKNIISIDVNLSKVAQIRATQATLPNGNILPLIGTNEVIVIPVKNYVNLYLTFSNSVAALGVDIPFSTLDPIGAKVGNVSLFPSFNINKVIGAAGLYFSKESGKNGFGLFADLTQVLDQAMFLDLGDAKVMSAGFAAKSLDSNVVRLNYSSISPSKSAKKRIDSELYKLHKKSRRLRLR